jgi:hypothetical protein
LFHQIVTHSDLFCGDVVRSYARRQSANRATELNFGPEISIGKTEANPSTPFLRYAPDGPITPERAGEALKKVGVVR